MTATVIKILIFDPVSGRMTAHDGKVGMTRFEQPHMGVNGNCRHEASWCHAKDGSGST